MHSLIYLLLLYSHHEMAVGLDMRGGGTSRYSLTCKLLSAYKALEQGSSTRGPPVALG